jgi:hypothetical protein
MSSRRPSKAFRTPGQVIGRSAQVLGVSSPRRKSNNKRSAPQEHTSFDLRATAPSFTPAGAAGTDPSPTDFPPLASGAVASASQAASCGSSLKSSARATSSTAASTASYADTTRRGVTVDESQNKVNEIGLASDDDDSLWADVAEDDDFSLDAPVAGDKDDATADVSGAVVELVLLMITRLTFLQMKKMLRLMKRWPILPMQRNLLLPLRMMRFLRLPHRQMSPMGLLLCMKTWLAFLLARLSIVWTQRRTSGGPSTMV